LNPYLRIGCLAHKYVLYPYTTIPLNPYLRTDCMVHK